MADDGRVTIRFEPAGRTVSVTPGSTLLEAVLAAGLAIDAPCAGAGTCGSCRVRATGALDAPKTDELELLGGAGIVAGKRLACRARALGDATVTFEQQERDQRVEVSPATRPLDVQQPGERGIHATGTAVGAAIDVGTTTMEVALVDLNSGETLVRLADLNPQRALGADVLSRVAHASRGGGPELQRLATGRLGELLSEALVRAGLSADQVVEALAVGNTAMTGLLLGRDVSALGSAPYAGAPTDGACVAAPDLGLAAFPALDICTLPGASAFIGSDVIAGMLATGIAERVAPTLLIDLGTNGEIVLAARGELIGASTAAGPAFEGASIECGMRAASGAIERVSITRDGLELGVIGDVAPVGICGSGLIDLVAALLDAGVLDASGRFVDSVGVPMRDRISGRGGVRVFVVDEDNDVYLSQKDIRQVQLAIGAVRAGVELMLAETGLGAGAVVLVIIAGGFGEHVRAASLVRLGLLPPLLIDRITYAGNTALAGAEMALVNADVRARAHTLAARVRTLDLASHPAFPREFVARLAFPG